MARRNQPPKKNAIVAAARRVPLDDTKATKALVAKRQEWQTDAWAFYDDVPEIKFAVNFLGNAMSKVAFFAATRSVETGDIIAVDAERSPLASSPVAAQAVAEIGRLRADVGGQGEIARLLTMNLEVAGECYLHGQEAQPDADPPLAESWNVRSVDEIENKEGKLAVKSSPEAPPRAVDAENETVFRIWQRHPRWSDWPDSHVRGVVSDAETLVILHNQVKAEGKSRQGAGILLVPSEITFGADEPTVDDADNNDDDPFMDELLRSLSEPIEDPSSASSVMPMVVRAPKEYLTADVFRLLTLGRTTDQTLDGRINAAINRVARGMNVPVEVVMGHMSTTFANAEQIDQDVFDDHLEPRCEMLCALLTDVFLRPQLREAGIDQATAEQVFVWYDASRLVRGASLEENADTLFDKGLISKAAYRRLKGATEDDAPDDIEALRSLAERKGIFTADLTGGLLKMVGIDVPISTITEVTAGPSPDAAAMQAAMLALIASGRSDDARMLAAAVAPRQPRRALTAASSTRDAAGRRLMEIDRDLRSRLIGAAEAAMERALERAGNRLKSKAGTLRETLRHVNARDAASHVGRGLVADLGIDEDGLLEGAWDLFETQFRTWSMQAGDSALAVVNVLVGGLTETARRELGIRYAENIGDAWTWLAAAMETAAKARMFDPVAASVVGEFDALAKVPTGILRVAMAQAGGAFDLKISAKGGAAIAVPTNNHPIGGVATGELTSEVLADHGMGIEGYRWVYGPASRKTFEPHLSLDGVEFVNFDDAVLSNSDSFPETPFYYPGDHSGCVCDFEPIIITP